MDLFKEMKKLSEKIGPNDARLLTGLNTLISERLQENTITSATKLSEQWAVEKAKIENGTDFEFWVIAKLAEIDAGHKTNTEADRAMGKLFGVVA